MKYIVTVNGKRFEVDVAVESGEVSAVEAAEKSATAPDTASPAQPAFATNKTAVEAPMPGNIWKALKKVGDVVKEGDVLIILEAMKMENEILAPRDGKVLEIAAAGKVVNTAEVIAVLA